MVLTTRYKDSLTFESLGQPVSCQGARILARKEGVPRVDVARAGQVDMAAKFCL
jgi:hypothetical protein